MDISQSKLSSDKTYFISDKYDKKAEAVLFLGDRLDFLSQIPDKTVQLVVTSPPYNIGKSYEKRTDLDVYLEEQDKTIKECARVLKDGGSLCWEVGNHIAKDGEVYPLDILIYPLAKKYGLKLRNRIIWRFEHGLHSSKRLSGRHEAILWLTKGDNYLFNLDPIRVPQKYPGKRNYKPGANYGKLSGNPLGKNPSDVWNIPNVKSNHPEKTSHPCQFPIELIERLVLSMTKPGDIVLDPYLGAGTAILAALLHNRRGFGSEIMKQYVDVSYKRIKELESGKLQRRPMGKPVYEPGDNKLAQMPQEFLDAQKRVI